MLMPLEKLKPGMIISENVYKNENDVLPYIPANKILDDDLITKLKINANNGISYVPIKFKSSVKQTIDNDLEAQALESLRKSNIVGTIKTAQTMVSRIINNPTFSYSLLKYALEKSEGDRKSLNVASFSIALAKEYNDIVDSKAMVDLNSIAVVALLKNIGLGCEKKENFDKMPKVRINKSVFSNFNESVYDKYDPASVPIYSYAILSENPFVTSSVKAAVLLSGENQVETGPLKVNINEINDKIATMVKIVNVCSRYDDILSSKLGQDRTPTEIIEQMAQEAKNRDIDLDLTVLLLQTIPLYSVGTRVILSNGLEGEVIKTVPDLPHRPIVRLLDNVNKTIVDLTKVKNVTIIAISKSEIDEQAVNKKENNIIK